MLPARTNEKTVIDMDFYRQRRAAESKQQEPPGDSAEEALNEIARYLLMAVRVITSRRH